MKIDKKVCTRCGEDKPLAEYGSRVARGRSGIQSQCRACKAAYAKAWRKADPARAGVLAASKRIKYAADLESHRAAARAYNAANPGRVRANNLRRFGIGVAEYEEMLAAQRGRCAGCGTTDSGDRRFDTFPVDHNHQTGAIRGLLCSRCNKALGLLDDDPDRLIALAAYLLQHSDVLGALIGTSA